MVVFLNIKYHMFEKKKNKGIKTTTHFHTDPIYYSTLNLTFTSQFSFHIRTQFFTNSQHQRKERERGGGERLGQIVRRPTAGGDRRSPCSTTTSAAPPPLVLLPTTRLGQTSLFFFFFFFFFLFFIFACSDSTLL